MNNRINLFLSILTHLHPRNKIFNFRDVKGIAVTAKLRPRVVVVVGPETMNKPFFLKIGFAFDVLTGSNRPTDCHDQVSKGNRAAIISK